MNIWEEFIKSFQNLDALGWTGQICGLLAFAIIGISYLFEKKKFALISTFAFILFFFESAFSKVYSNAIIAALCAIRNFLTFYFLYKYDRQLPRYIVLLILLAMIISTLIYIGATNTWTRWDNYFPVLIVGVVTFTQNRKNEYIVKAGQLYNEVGYLVFYIVNRLPFSLLRQVILVITILIGIILMIIRNIKKKKSQVAS